MHGIKLHCPRCGEEVFVWAEISTVQLQSLTELKVFFNDVVIRHLCPDKE
jgi:hypothetical protein